MHHHSFLLALLLLCLSWQVRGAMPNKKKPDTLMVALTGDLLLANTYKANCLPANGGEDLFAHATPWLRRADIALGNLEGPLCDTSCNTTTKNKEHRFAFRCPPKYANVLADAGYDFLSLANNHIHDFGKAGIAQTTQTLDEVGIAHAGDVFHRSFVVVQRSGIRFGICAFGHNGYTYKHTDTTLAKKIIAKARKQCDVLIVSFHGGNEGQTARHLPLAQEKYMTENRGNLRLFAHFCIDNGADIVFGHGPHVPRCVEVFKDRFIAYSLGNFCTPFGISLKGEMGYAPLILVNIRPNGSFINGQIFSYKQVPGVGPRYDAKHHCTTEIKALTEEDVPEAPIEISKYGRIRYKKTK